MSNMVIANNIMALNSHRNLKTVGTKQEKASQKLSSGYRINSAADDAAGLAISEKMRAQIRGLNMASKNAQDAISLIQTAEGGLNEIDNMIQRIRELVVYAANDTNEHNAAGSGDRQKIQDEINQLTQEIDSMAERVEFNKKKLINGSYEAVPLDSSVVTGLKEATRDLALAQRNYRTAQQEFDEANKAVTPARDAFASILGDAKAAAAIKAVIGDEDSAVSTAAVDLQKAISSAVGAFANIRSSSAWANFTQSAEYTDLAGKMTALLGAATGANATNSANIGYLNSVFKEEGAVAAAASALGKSTDGGVTFTTGVYASANVKATALSEKYAALGDEQANYYTAKGKYDAAPKTNGLWFQVGANAEQGVQLSIGSIKTDKLGIGDGNGVSYITVLAASGVDITATLDVLDTALTHVTTERAKLGAAQNRLEYTMNSLDISSENIQSAESRIRDTDMAKEMMNLTQANILQQAAVSMLAQANQAPQSVLQLLQ